MAATVRTAKRAAQEAQDAQAPSAAVRKIASAVTKKKGTLLPKCLIGVRSAADVDKVEWHRGEYGVFMDRQNFSCIRVGLTDSHVEVIRMRGEALDVDRVSLSRFEERWKPYIYPLVRAAEVYVEGAKTRGITEEAREHLSQILKRSLSTLKLTTERGEAMTMKKGGPEMTVTTVKNGKKVVLATTGKAGKEPAKEKVKFLTREEATKIIKSGGKLSKGRDNDRRKGSAKALALDAIQSCRTVAEALKATYKLKGIKQEMAFGDVRSAVRRGYVVVKRK